MAALLIAAITAPVLNGCSDDEVSKKYSTQYRVFCYFTVVQYAEMFNTMGNYGQFMTIRKRVDDGATRLEMSTMNSTNTYSDALLASYQFGLGGLIIGTTYYGEPRAYDLACPTCDRANKRLSLRDNATASCSNCHIVYNLSDDGAIVSAPSEVTSGTPRPLYRYRITYDGNNVNIHN